MISKIKKKKKNTGVGWLPHPPPGDLPDPGIEPASLVAPALTDGFFTTSTTREALPLQSVTGFLSPTIFQCRQWVCSPPSEPSGKVGLHPASLYISPYQGLWLEFPKAPPFIYLAVLGLRCGIQTR